MDGERILLAEDDPAIADMYKLRLQQEGWEVEVARDGEEAVDAALNRTPSILLLDIQMPKLNGIEVLRKLRADQRTKDLTVVVVSNTPGAESMRDAYSLGISAWAVKSKTAPNALVDLVRAYLDAPV